MKKIYFIVFILFYFSKSILGQLSGIYTIGGINPDFQTINSASQALSSQGVSGATTFNIRPGIYNYTVSINYIPNASVVMPVVFQSETGNSNDVVVVSHGTSDDFATITLFNANNVSIKNITIENSDNGISCNGNTVKVIQCYSSVLDHCIIKGGYTTSGNIDEKSAIRILQAWENQITSFTITDCQIITKGYGIYYSGPNGRTYIINNLIQSDLETSVKSWIVGFSELTGNEISRDLDLDNQNALKLHNNVIHGIISILGNGLDMQNNIVYGIPNYFTGISQIESGVPIIKNNTFIKPLDIIDVISPKINDNTFSVLNITYSCNLYFVNNKIDSLYLKFASNSKIYKNKIKKYLDISLTYSNCNNVNNYLINNFICGEFHLGLHSFWNIYHNNFNLELIDWQLVSDINIINNIFQLPYSISFNYLNNHNNNYFPSGGGNEVDHFNFDPMFIDSTDLHIQNYALKGLAFYLSNVADDFDGDCRGTQNTIGADEICLPDVFTAGNDTSIYCGDSIILMPTYNHLANYHWYPSFGLIDTTVARTKASPGTTTTYYVHCFDSCISYFDSIRITVNPFEVDAGNNSQVQCSIPKQLKATYNSSAEYYWFPVDGLNNPNIYNPVATPLQTTTYFVTAVVPNCCTSVDSIKLTLNEQPLALFTCNIYSNLVEFINSSSFPAYYLWDFGDGSTSTLLNPTHSYYSNGYYTVKLNVKTPCGTENTYSKTIGYNVNFIEPFNENLELVCYPNPFDDKIEVSYNIINESSVYIYISDYKGAEIKTYRLINQKSGKNNINLNLKTLNDGVYFLKFSTNHYSKAIKIIHIKQ